MAGTPKPRVFGESDVTSPATSVHVVKPDVGQDDPPAGTCALLVQVDYQSAAGCQPVANRLPTCPTTDRCGARRKGGVVAQKGLRERACRERRVTVHWYFHAPTPVHDRFAPGVRRLPFPGDQWWELRSVLSLSHCLANAAWR
jgi:hypothetical protein